MGLPASGQQTGSSALRQMISLQPACARRQTILPALWLVNLAPEMANFDLS
jgi:hypothetical protein